MKLKIISLFLICFCSLYAQQLNVSGIVTDKSTGEVLPGVNIRNMKSKSGTISDLDGKYNIKASKGDILTFSFIGLKTESIEVKNAQINIKLTSNALELDEVVAVGYGNMRKSDLTGALGSVNMNDAKNNNNTNINQILQGRLSGVQATTNSGVPGSAMSINIRGIGSMSSSSQPLYVIDGIVMDNSSLDLDAVQRTNSGSSPLDPMRDISPEDISNIEVLKDASATAIYGSRGANGVILITTKKAEKGKTQAHFETSYGVSQLLNRMDVMDGITFARYANEKAKLINAIALPYPVDANGEFLTPIISKDWQKDYTKMGSQFKLRGDASASYGKSNFFVSLGYTNSDGVLQSVGLKKYDFRLNNNIEVNDWFSLNSIISIANTIGNLTVGPSSSSASQTMLSTLYQTRPVLNGIQDDAGGIDVAAYGSPTPKEWIENHQDQTNATTLFAKLEGRIKLSNDFNIITRIGYNTNNAERRLYYGRLLFQGRDTKGKADRVLSLNKNLNFDNLINYYKKFDKNNRLDGTAAITINYNGNSYQDYQATYFMDDTMLGNAMQSGSDSRILADNLAETTYLSGLFRLNYVFKEKIFLTATGRADGVSKFAKGNQWGFFPSFAAAYNLQQESWFMKSLPDISQFKLRLGWGQVGNSSSPAYATMNQYAYIQTVSPTGDPITALQAISKGNPALTWETSEQVNAGLNLAMWNNRLRVSCDVYYKETKNQLQKIALPPSTGFAYTWVNMGNVSNKGIELELNGDLVRNNNITITLGGNISINRNKIISIGRAPDANGNVMYFSDNIGQDAAVNVPGNVFMQGQPIGMFWGYKTNGIVQTGEETTSPTFFGTSVKAGDIRFVDTKGNDNNITQNDQTIIGNPNPDFIFGVNGSVDYHGLRLSFMVNGSVGNQILNATAVPMSNLSQSGAWDNRLTKAYTEAWTVDNPSNTYPRMLSNPAMFQGIITDRMIEDGSFMKLSSLALSYDIKLKRMFINKMTVSLNASNLLYLTKYSGFSPELPSWNLGVALNEFPDSKALSFGVLFTF